MTTPAETISRRRHFAQVPDDLATDLRLSHIAVRLWLRLDKYAGKDGRAFPSRARLAVDLGVSKGSIARALGELAKTGWITRRPGTAGGVWNTTLNDQPATPHVRDAEPADPVSNMGRGSRTSETGATHMRDTEGHPPKDTQLSDRSAGHGAPAGAERQRPAARRKPTKLSQEEHDEQWSLVQDLCAQEGEDDPVSVWWTLRKEHHASRPGAFMEDLIDRGQWDGFVARHGIGEYKTDGTAA